MVHFRKNEDIPEVALTVSFRTFLRLTLLIAATLLIWTALHKAGHALLLIFTAFFLTLALNGPVYWLGKQLPGKRRGDRVLATALAFLIVVVLLGAFLASIVPPLVRQTDNLVHVAPKLVRQIHDQHSPIGNFVRHYHLEKQLNTISGQLSDRLSHAGGQAFSTAQRVGSSFFSLLTILVLTFMMLIEGPRWLVFFKDVVPDRHHAMADRLLHDMYKVIKGYVNGQVLLAALASVLIMPAVLLLHIGYPAAIMVIIFVCGLIPLVGHTIGAVIVTLVALFHSTSAALFILAYYLIYMQIEAYIIQPRIQANSTNMSPLLVFASVIIGVSFGGLFGGLVAIPVAGCIRIAVLEYMRSQGIIDSPKFDRVTKAAK
ncbi:MAG TPA: AI-2E family transporter [Candidatus Saccharimonadia bacterium]|nr:AI-2E family transporter [Candidatus Saccharimonadia bacterium]